MAKDIYKVKQLQAMLKHEENPAEVPYGANLMHWAGDSKPIQIDAGGLHALIQHYLCIERTQDAEKKAPDPETRKKSQELYHKLHDCLKISLTAPIQENGDDLSCHADNIVVSLAKCIESKFTWYDTVTDVWCDYFILRNGQYLSEREPEAPSRDDDEMER